MSEPNKINILGMELDEWTHKSCVAHFGVGDDWATLCDIRSKEQGKGHATELLGKAIKYYKALKKEVGGSVALNQRMRNIYKRLNIKEFKDE